MARPGTFKKATAPAINVAEYFSAQIELSGKSQKEIAEECGYTSPNIITMIKQGKTKLPMARLGQTARALGIDPLHLYKIVMSEYDPDTWAALQKDVLSQPVISKNEFEIIELLRSLNVGDPKIRTNEDQNSLKQAFASLKTGYQD